MKKKKRRPKPKFIAVGLFQHVLGEGYVACVVKCHTVAQAQQLFEEHFGETTLCKTTTVHQLSDPWMENKDGPLVPYVVYDVMGYYEVEWVTVPFKLERDPLK